MTRIRNGTLTYGWLAALFLSFTAFLLRNHFLKAYSDPIGWLLRAERMLQGSVVTSRPPVYPAFLIPVLKVLGPYYVFLANLPLLLLVVALIYLLTLLSRRGAAAVDLAPAPRLSAFAAVGILMVVQQGIFLELLNPFREALAFSLMLATAVLVLSYLDRKKPWYLIAAGVFMGLSIGARETCILILPPLGMLYLYHVITDRDFPPLRPLFFFGAGFLVGMIPFMVQNVLHSGNAWLPSNAANRWLDSGGKVEVPKEFPVPGMHFDYFFKTGKGTVLFFLDKYHWWGIGLFFLGLLESVRRRYVRILLFVFPAALVQFLFYCFFWYVKGRYLLAVDLFVLPIAGIGLAALLTSFAAIAGKLTGGRVVDAERIGVPLLASVVLVSLVAGSLQGPRRLQAWDVEMFREEVVPRLEEPYLFVSPGRHHQQMLSWLFQVPYRRKLLGINEKRMQAEGLDAVMKQTGRRFLREYSSKNIYSYEKPLLLKNWFDFEEVLSFKKLSLAPDLYGKRMDESLYRVRPWSAKSFEKKVELEGDAGKYLLVVDFYRFWDIPGRSFGRLYVDDVLVEERIPNGTHLVEIEAPPGRSHIVVRALSDAGMTKTPVIEVRPIDEEMTLPFGAGPRYWYYPLLSDKARRAYPLKSDSLVIFDDGEVMLPNFALPGSEVFATFRMEFYQEDRLFRRPNTITFDAGGGEQTFDLPSWRRSSTATISLGPGTGGLEFVPLSLRTSLPPFGEQLEMRNNRIITAKRGFGFVKIFDVRLTPAAKELEGEFTIDVGSVDDGPWIDEGFYGPEKAGKDLPVRWTAARASLRIPHPPEKAGIEVRLRSREVRPEAKRTTPRFAVSGRPVPPGDVRTNLLSDQVVEYVFQAAVESLPGKGFGRIEIIADPWVPAEVLGSADRRELGILVEAVTINPLETGP